MKIKIYAFIKSFPDTLNIYHQLKKNNDVAYYTVMPVKNQNDIRGFGSIYYFIFKGFNSIIYRMKIQNKYIRYLNEIIFDFHSAIHLHDASIIIHSNGFMPFTLKKNKKLGGTNIYISGNPCDLDIYDKLILERKLMNNVSDVYNFKPRLKRYSKALEVPDKVIVANTYCFNSYAKYINQNRVVLAERIFFNKDNLQQHNAIHKNTIYTFCYIAHTQLLKGLHILLEAWQKINSENVQLIIGGPIDRELKPHILNRIKRLKNVKYDFRFISNLSEFYNHSDVYVCPSLIDASPVTVPEAMHCKLPVIVSENCGNSFMIENGRNGMVYKNDDSTQLASCIQWFIDNKHKSVDMGKNAYNDVLNQMNTQRNMLLNTVKKLIN